jgi:hypothetical protein
LQERGGLDIREAFIDGSFVPAKKGAVRSVGQNAAKGAGSWPLRTLPVFVCLASASPHEVKLPEMALECLRNLSVTKRMTAMISMKIF